MPTLITKYLSNTALASGKTHRQAGAMKQSAIHAISHQKNDTKARHKIVGTNIHHSISAIYFS
ncbi:hypothetical protein MUS1_14355 [Marinomonas ushuaiensis DSM 15871]|uniref:Uncharacterized protein n=1 Tax=Marinomonas ushuaiensis DSM 15871 TaxID=1122207 RepID=X7E2R7_9GAMM|nr:hypothetical protein MUS1_08955 [Marinomonas ushuaiensis DSM 15871]ETX10557.1 hypothetical protein MUS1_14355 [Marinomonas ushuaiensis DSM 15871]